MSKAAKRTKKKAAVNTYAPPVNFAWTKGPSQKAPKTSRPQPPASNAPESSLAQSRRESKISPASAEAPVESTSKSVSVDNPPVDANNFGPIESHFDAQSDSSANAASPIPRPVTAPPKLARANGVETPVPALPPWPPEEQKGSLFRAPVAASPTTTPPSSSVGPQLAGSPRMGGTVPLHHPMPHHPHLSHPIPSQQWGPYYYGPPHGYDPYMYWKPPQPLHPHHPYPQHPFPQACPPPMQPSPRTQPTQLESPSRTSIPVTSTPHTHASNPPSPQVTQPNFAPGTAISHSIRPSTSNSDSLAFEITALPILEDKEGAGSKPMSGEPLKERIEGEKKAREDILEVREEETRGSTEEAQQNMRVKVTQKGLSVKEKREVSVKEKTESSLEESEEAQRNAEAASNNTKHFSRYSFAAPDYPSSLSTSISDPKTSLDNHTNVTPSQLRSQLAPSPECVVPELYEQGSNYSSSSHNGNCHPSRPGDALQRPEPVPTKAGGLSPQGSQTPSGRIGDSISRPDASANARNGVPSLDIEGSRLALTSFSAGTSGTLHMVNRFIPPPSAKASRWVGGSLQQVPQKIQGLLNNLTAGNFGPVSDQIIQYANRSEQMKDGPMLMHIVKLVFASARNDPIYAEMYAQLCRKMTESLSPDIQDETIHSWDEQPITGGLLFRKYLFALCQEEFRRGWTVKGISFAVAPKAKRQGLGLVRFMAQLFKQKMLTERVMHECIKKLLSNAVSPKEEEIESLCELLTITGQTLDHHKACDYMDAYFERMDGMLGKSDLSWRLRFMLLDVIELRARQWRIRITKGSTEELTA